MKIFSIYLFMHLQDSWEMVSSIVGKNFQPSSNPLEDFLTLFSLDIKSRLNDHN